MSDPIDDLEDAIDAARRAGGEVSLPLDVAVALRNRLRPLEPWGGGPAADASAFAEQARQNAMDSDRAAASASWSGGDPGPVRVVRVVQEPQDVPHVVRVVRVVSEDDSKP